LRITVSPASIAGEFVTVDPTSGKTGVGDSFTLNLKANTVSNGLSAAPKAGSPPPKANVKSKSTQVRKK
jgi:hypothetical protein